MSESSEVSIEIAAACATVFRALTEAKALEGWFAEHADVDLAAGRYEFWGRHTPGNPAREAGGQRCISYEAERSLVFEWRIQQQVSLVTIVLNQCAGGCNVSVTQESRRLDEGSTSTSGLAEMWCLSLQNLRSWVETGSAAWLPDFSRPAVGEVRLEIDANASPSAIFAGLTQPELLNRWMAADATVEQVVGGKYDMGWGEGDGRPVKILDLEPDHRLVLSWADPKEQDTMVTWTLEGSEGATRITLVHGGFAGGRTLDDYYGGWADFLVRLKFLSEQGEAWQGPVVGSVSAR